MVNLSLMTPAHVHQLLEAAHTIFGVLPDSEITLERNPGDADLQPGLLAKPERAEGHLGLRADSISGHTHERRTAATALFATDADPDHLSRGRLGPDEEVGRFDVEDPHRPLPSACGSGCR